MALTRQYSKFAKKTFYTTRVIVSVLLVAFIGFVGMFMLVYVIQPSHNNPNNIIYAVMLALLGLAVPYWALKLILHEAHIWDPRERELRLEDFSKDQEQLEREEKKKS